MSKMRWKLMLAGVFVAGALGGVALKVAFFHAYPHQYAGAQRLTHALARELSSDFHYFRRRNATELVHAQNGFFDQVIWARSTSSDTDHKWAGWQPMLSRNFPFHMQIEMRDLDCAFELIRSPNEVGR